MGGTLNIARADEGAATALEGHGVSLASQGTSALVYDTLVQYDSSMQPQPQLAESWDLASDYTQIKLNLRKGIQYHTGRELTADDIKWNVLRVRDPKANATQLIGMSGWFTTIDTPDKYTVVLKAEQPRSSMFDLFSYLNIADQQTVEGPDSQSKAVGTGAFTLAEWVPGDHWHFLKNKAFWQSGRPYLDEVVIRIVSDPQSRSAQLEAGAVSVDNSPTPVNTVRLLNDPKYNAILIPGIVYLMCLNTTRPPTDNQLVRQALNYAIDRKRWVDTILLGQGSPQALPWPGSSPAYEANKQSAYAFDLEKARSLLEQAGVLSADLDFTYSSQYSELGNLGQIYQADLSKLGIKLNLIPLDFAAWASQSTSLKYNGMTVGVTQFNNVQPSTLPLTSVFWNLTSNIAGFKSDQYAQLTQQVLTEPDASRRQQATSAFNDFILDQSVTVSFALGNRGLLASTNVHDAGQGLNAALQLTNTWVA